MTFRSYAQNFEDVILMRAFRSLPAGRYIDVGANDPVHDSVSLAFYEKGWRGVHVEPVASYAKKLRKARPDETVIEAALGREAGSTVLYDVPDTGLTTGDKTHADRHVAEGMSVSEITVPVHTLAEVFEGVGSHEVHWLKIDVEGMEGEVLQGWGTATARPWIVIIESTLPNLQEEDFEDWEEEITGRGYEFVYFDGLNRFYVHEDHEDLKPAFGAGPNVFDEFVLDETTGFVREVVVAARDVEERLREKLAIADRLTLTANNLATEAQEHRASVERLLRERIEELTRERDAHQKQASDHQKHASALSTRLEDETSLSEQRRLLLDQTTHAVHQVAEMKASASWRLSAPIRLAGGTARRLLRPAKPVLRRGLDAGLAGTRASPAFHRVVLIASAASPSLRSRLSRYAAVRPPAVRTVTHEPLTKAEAKWLRTRATDLSPRAEYYYRRLLEARAIAE